MTKLINTITIIFTLICSVLFLGLVTRGNVGKPIYYQYEKDTQVGGPFESSNSTARYALTEAIVDNNTFFLNPALAKFAAPDVVDYNGKFLSIFTPGVSLITIPFYVLGKYFYMPQLFAYFATTAFAIANLFLVSRLARKLGAGFFASILSGVIFLFATNALGYSQTLTQHHMSVTFLLLAMLNAFEERTFVNNFLFGSYLGIATLLDIPNPIIMAPLALFVAWKNFKFDEEKSNKLKISIKTGIVGLACGLLPFALAFAYYNYQTTGSYTKLAQNIGRTSEFNTQIPEHLSADIPDTSPNEPGLHLPFETRKQLNGLYILLISNERSWLFYSPIVLFGIAGTVFLYLNKKTRTFAVLMSSIVLVNIVLYSMFGDPWGGWAFGSRYLIPAASIMCGAIGIAITKLKKNPIFSLLFAVALIYSIAISSLGVFTTNAIPPKIEAINLSVPIPYTYQYNLDLLKKGTASALLYNESFKKLLTSNAYLAIFITLVSTLSATLYVCSVFEKKKK